MIVLATAAWHVVTDPVVVDDWWSAATTDYSSPLTMVGVALLVFPSLALGMSGYETGVAVMPQIRGAATDTPARPAGRIRGTRKLLTSVALIMSGFLLVSSLATTLLIPAEEFESGGEANGRALAYLAHHYLGEAFGTLYDVSTIAILWFAGASALAGLLNLVPRYLPRYGMAPEWTRAVRPLVLLFMAIAFAITFFFEADVDAQSGAYATGVLMLMLSASFAATVATRHRGHVRASIGFGVVTAVFAYTLVVNILDRPDGLRIASLFILGILLTSFVSRIHRAFELRAGEVALDETAARMIDAAAAYGPLRIITNEPDERDETEYREKEYSQREETHIPNGGPVLLLEVTVTDSSDFTANVTVRGEERHGYNILCVDGAVVANTIAAVLLHLRDRTGNVPHAYVNWTEGHPLGHLLRFLIFGDGEVAPTMREVLRRAERDPARRPRIHVG